METTKRRGRPPGTDNVSRANKQKILDFIRAYHAEHGYAPILEEIAVGIGKKANYIGNLQPLVQQLIREKFLVSAGDGSRRSLALAKKQPRRTYFKIEGE